MALPTITRQRLPHRGPVALATTAPSATTDDGAKAEAHARIPQDGRIYIALDAAKTVTMRVYCPVMEKWILRGAGTGVHAKAFLANSCDYFEGPPGALCYFTVEATTANMYTDAEGA